MKRRDFLAGAALACTGSGWGPAYASAAVAPPAPWGATPNARQLRWHALQACAFVHFGMNTMTGREWGDGSDPAATFNPSGFDADQIAACARDTGLRGLIFTAKHHDGFCLWPSAYTDYSIRNSPFRDGKADLVREMSDACRRHGLAFGVYLSPWDRHHAEYGRPAYIEYYRNQLRELLTSYGEIFEMWFDGANGGDGWYGGARERRQIDAARYYDWPTTWRLVHELQPKAALWGASGSELRWVGNEQGFAGDPCWATMDTGPYSEEKNMHGVRNGAVWRPAEADVSIRPGWFWKAREDGQVKTPAALLKIYLESVGRGAGLLLNIPPDSSGRVPERDAASLRTWGALLRQTFAVNLARGARVSASSEYPGCGAAQLLSEQDGYWCAGENATASSVELALADDQRFDLVRVREYLPLGQRVGAIAIDAWQDGGWREVAQAPSVGSERLLRLASPVRTTRVRLRVLDATASPALCAFGLFLLPPAEAWEGAAAPVARTPAPRLRIESASSPGAEKLLDGDPDTLWLARGAQPQVTLALENETRLAAVTLLPARRLPAGAGHPLRCVVQVSADGQHWDTAADTELANIAANPVEQYLSFDRPRGARYVRVQISRSSGDAAAIAAIGVVAALP